MEKTLEYSAVVGEEIVSPLIGVVLECSLIMPPDLRMGITKSGTWGCMLGELAYVGEIPVWGLVGSTWNQPNSTTAWAW